jgi:glycosyltransferase involved in cell wall biosynthesis
VRIVVDLQGAQTASRYRGIGRYSAALAASVVRNAGGHEVWFVLNGAFGAELSAVRAGLEALVPPTRIRVYDPPAPVAEHEPANLWRTRAAELVREHVIASLRPDAVLVTSLFEGYVDDAATSVHLLDETPTAVVLYDLIPLLNPEAYLSDPGMARYYQRKLEHLRRSELLLAISDHSRSEAIHALGVDADRVVTISTAVDEDFAQHPMADADAQALLGRLGVMRPYVLAAPGGFDPRKNMDGLIRAYGQLPGPLRASHQLVITSDTTAQERAKLEKVAELAGLSPGDLVLTDYLQDHDLKALYAGCEVFVLPSLHEGFGLPALEAMTCGAAVIGSDSTSVPEVVPWPDARFDPTSQEDISRQLHRVLTDVEHRDSLKRRGLDHARTFSWDATGQRALRALEHLAGPARRRQRTGRQRLAVVTPMPPERTGIATYSSALLPYLAQYYDVVVVTNAPQDLGTSGALTRRSMDWFREHGADFDRIVYQVGNSPFHAPMLDLLRVHPGVVVLHDFFLSGLLAHEELHGDLSTAWTDSLLYSHGMPAVAERFRDGGVESARAAYPCNLEVLQRAEQVIVHSEHSRRLAEQWYGIGASSDWTVVPHLAELRSGDRAAARNALGVPDDAFLVCGFGLIDPAKQSRRLVQAFLDSELAHDPRNHLVLVGENHGGRYGESLLQLIAESLAAARVTVTGWVDDETFERYLAATDIAVQLRIGSRGETSGAVLGCLSYGVPTVVNAHGAMADLPTQAVHVLADDFDDAELREALQALRSDGDLRERLSSEARRLVEEHHSPPRCAARYADVVEQAVDRRPGHPAHLLRRLVADVDLPSNDERIAEVAQAVAACARHVPQPRQLLVDVSTLVHTDLRTGIERVVRAQLVELLNSPPPGVRVEPVYLDTTGPLPRYRYASRYAASLLGLESERFDDAPVDVVAGDLFFCADHHPHGVVAAANAGVFDGWRSRGVSVSFAIYDLLPVLRPEFFPVGADEMHGTFLRAAARNADRFICISWAVAAELTSWLGEEDPAALLPEITAVHLGADLDQSVPTTGLPNDASDVLARIASAPAFLVVGTLEPRKGHAQALSAFELLWEQGADVRLVFVGGQGWLSLPDDQRRTIPTLVRRIQTHPELGKRLFWLSGISDEYLERVYASAACLLAPSEGEGFGLPLIEAGRHGLPVLARDIPVFREVAGEAASYFAGLAPTDLADAVAALTASGFSRNGVATPSWLTWRENIREVTALLLSDGQ